MTNAIGFIWDEKARAMRVQPDYARRAAAMFTNGYGYLLAPDRTPEDHKHMFALIRMAWENLPHHLAEEFPAPEALRKKALVKTGFYNEARIAHETEVDAIKTAAHAAQADGFALVSRRGTWVIVRTPKSQAQGAMDREEFRASKAALLAYVSDLIGVDVTTLQRQAVAA
ncbi:hypothetical protein [Caulobacter segnis]|uniref:Uncharacterized protein n=1 Tax=Caulobacter segnis TaxID=88688 RepID=A0A2W5VF23_9CAUL|nr:hypothetical protein [Caulobacter segnis]PZR36453.1 MAG: hypothetical protein DI526_03175 [Caulobacter segnis]